MMSRGTWVASCAVLGMAAAATALPSTPPTDLSRRSQQPPPQATAEVRADHLSFGPPTLTVAVGTTVTWTNRDDIPHTVVSADRVFKSKVLGTDEQFVYTFTRPGSYSYSCSIHPKMLGRVVVR